ncbi:hypothetical protein ACFPJ1_29460 [Kribbella qitaiheensis]|uniref:hypothetical protein n=1 Tax=Kribbella qitaiheensis TaxID=1544730 RepID=UPI00361A2F78
MSRPRATGRIRRLLLFAAAIVTAAIAVSGLYAYIFPPALGIYREYPDEAASVGVYLEVTFNDVEPSSSTILATVQVDILVPRERVSSPGDSKVKVGFRTGSQTSELEFVPMLADASDDRVDAWSSRPANIRFETYGNQSSFPWDSYELAGFLDVVGSGDFSVINESGETRGYPVYLSLSTGNGASDWSVRQIDFSSRGSAGSSFDSPSIYLRVSRPLSTIIYLMTVAGLPLLIALAFASKSLTRRHRLSPGDATSPLELASALLALLALRQVLTPANVSSITLLDRVLAIELAVILVLTLIVYLDERPPAVAQSIDASGVAVKPVEDRNDISSSSVPLSPHWAQASSGLWLPRALPNEEQVGVTRERQRRIAPPDARS